VETDEDLAVPRHGILDVLVAKDLRSAVLVDAYGLHRPILTG
jgi:hypothetical protein